MDVNFNYIRNRIGEYRKKDLIDYCLKHLRNSSQNFPYWYLLTILKWTLIYGEKSSNIKELDQKKFSKLFNHVSNFNQDHISQFIKSNQVDRAFHILFNQQFYLQKPVYLSIYAAQLKLFSSLNTKGKFDPDTIFKQYSGLSIKNFLYILQIIWLFINIDELKNAGFSFYGYFDANSFNLISHLINRNNLEGFFKLLTIDPANVGDKISDFRNKVNNVEFQTMEVSFFTMYPFLMWQNKIRLIHKDVFSHTANYFIYDYLKSKDQNFTTDFGIRLEKYVEEGLNEIHTKYSTELELKKILIPKSKLVDFHIKDDNIFIECKATEMQPMPSVIPTNEYIYNSLKDSLLKAYFEQMLEVSKQINPDSENWGIILTYKEFFWSHYPNLYNIGKDNYPDLDDNSHLPPENVFIIDLYTWDKLIQIVKNGPVTILDILKKAKQNNSQKETAKQLFGMHLDEYEVSDMNLNYLNIEMEQMKIENE